MRMVKAGGESGLMKSRARSRGGVRRRGLAQRLRHMDRIGIIQRFNGSEEQAVTQFITDYLTGGGLDPEPCDDALFAAAYKLDHGDVRVLAVKRAPDDLSWRMLRASTQAGCSIIIARLADNPRYDDVTLVDIVVRDGDSIDLLCDRTMFVSPNGRMALISNQPDLPGVIWVANQLHIVDLPFDPDERSDGICRAARLMLLALRNYRRQ